jgi:SAM-dependent methyltransferase
MDDERPGHWDVLARGMEGPQFQDIIALCKREENLSLVSAWAPARVRRLLKTDLFEEGFGKDALLDDLAIAYPHTVGMDISHVVAAAARKRLAGGPCVVGNVCDLPFGPSSFDLIVSISTLDHLAPTRLARALAELCRVLTPGGCLVLTLDSAHNPLHVFSNHLRRRMGRVYAERCYRVGEVEAALAGQPVVVTEVTAIYHVPFGVNAMAKLAHRLAGRRADRLIEAAVRACQRLGQYRTRFFTGRYIALRVVKPPGPAATEVHG